MKQLNWTVLFVGSVLAGAVVPTFGAAGDFSPPVVVTPFQGNVTYSETSPVLNTYAGFRVTGFSNSGINTINDVVVTFEATVTDPTETLALYLPEVYLSGLPAGCSWPTGELNTVTITCRFKQFKPSAPAFPDFTVFYKVPAKRINGNADGGLNPDYISTTHTILYAEGLNDCANDCGNSKVVTPGPNQVLLGTTNPVDVRSGVPRNGLKLYTGTGVPKNEPNKKFTEEVLIPSLAGLVTPIDYATSTLEITWVSSTDTTNGVQCGNLENFVECPTYATKVLKPKSSPTDPDVPVVFKRIDPLKITYRIDGANVKRQPAQLFNNLQIDYFPDGSDVPIPVPKTCTNNQASEDGTPCVLTFKCYKQNVSTPDLPSDCEIVTLGIRNGRLAIQ